MNTLHLTLHTTSPVAVVYDRHTGDLKVSGCKAIQIHSYGSDYTHDEVKRDVVGYILAKFPDLIR